MAIIQAGRWEKVLEKVDELAVQYGIDRRFARQIFDAIHEASVQEQNK